MSVLNRMHRFTELAREAEAIANSDSDDWRLKYDLIFSFSIRGQIDVTRISVDWCDPDSSYEEDVRTYVEALVSKATEVEALLKSLARDEIAKGAERR